MAIKPYVEDRKADWQSVYALSRPGDVRRHPESTAETPELRGEVHDGQSVRGRKGDGKSTRRARRSDRYEVIDIALREIAAALPRTHKEVFEQLDGRVEPPDRKPFRTAGGWVKGFKQDRHAASAWLSQAWARLGLPPFARGPKPVVSVTTRGSL
jgi:hypothetical protein